ncbi:MAG: hypothetical protein KAH21_02510 [Spirochaetaceae bacterium]|nr:hypothetical protein [Spirochaetaceae bacterium]
MRKFILFIVLAAVVAVGYSIFSDPERREKAFSAIEGSTGVNLGENTGEAIGDAAGKIFKDLGDTLSDPKFHRSLERWGKDALDKLDDSQLQKMKEDLQREASEGTDNFDKVFESYLGKLGDS